MNRRSLIFVFLIVIIQLAESQSTGVWYNTGSLLIPRAYHKSVELPNGKILVIGGARHIIGIGDFYLSSCEIYDPATGDWALTDSLNTGRYFHTATLLQNGKVLVAGGAFAVGNMFYQLKSCELYDPPTGHWSIAASMNVQRSGHTATLLPNGKVLVAGGNYSISSTTDIFLKSCELYDPQTDQWSFTDSMAFPRSQHSASILPNGNVLVVSGHYAIAYPDIIYLRSCEVFDWQTEIWSAIDSLPMPQSGNQSVLLNNGNVLAVGGEYNLKSCELYNTTDMKWSSTDSLNVGRYRHTVTLLPDSKVLVIGSQGLSRQCEIYDPMTEKWSLTDSLQYDVNSHSAILLSNGKVLLSGGYSYSAGGYLSNCMLFDYKVTEVVNSDFQQQKPQIHIDVYPNPFNSSTVINYFIQNHSYVIIEIYDNLGRLLRTLVKDDQSAGNHKIVWDGNSQGCISVSSGIYYCVLKINNRLAGQKKMLILR